MTEVLAQKITSLQRCVARAREELERAGAAFASDHTAQDAALLNAIRACEITLDLANMVVRRRRLGIPSESRESFGILIRESVIDRELGRRLQRMVGFRNLAVHRYRELDMDIVQSVIRKDFDDLLAFAEHVRPLLESGD
jgi:uncharacterized protein YutE (UPF0331/DUF86 family)